MRLVLDLDPDRAPPAPRAAATVLVVREREALEIYCVVRHPKSGFLGGVLAFPGGKVDPADEDPLWAARTTPLDARIALFAAPAASHRALAVAACREALEEAAIVPLVGDALDGHGAVALRDAAAATSFAAALSARGLVLDVARLAPFARWVTPTAESRRFDAVFFLLPAPRGQDGAHDGHETTSGFWGAPADLLARWEKGELQIAPPTVRCLELLSTCDTVAAARALADAQSLLPIQPTFVADAGGGGAFLALPGDPAHEERARRVAGPTRFVLREGRFVSADPEPSC